MRYVWDRRLERWVEAVRHRPQDGVSIIRDAMDPTLHPATGETFDSKSRFREATRAAGCVELGNDAPLTSARPQIDRRELRNDLHRAYAELEAGRPAPQVLREGMSRRYG